MSRRRHVVVTSRYPEGSGINAERVFLRKMNQRSTSDDEHGDPVEVQVRAKMGPVSGFCPANVPDPTKSVRALNSAEPFLKPRALEADYLLRHGRSCERKTGAPHQKRRQERRLPNRRGRPPLGPRTRSRQAQANASIPCTELFQSLLLEQTPLMPPPGLQDSRVETPDRKGTIRNRPPAPTARKHQKRPSLHRARRQCTSGQV